MQGLFFASFWRHVVEWDEKICHKVITDAVRA